MSTIPRLLPIARPMTYFQESKRISCAVITNIVSRSFGELLMILSQVTPVSSSILNLIYDSSFIMYVPLRDRVLNNLSCIQPQSWSKLVNEALKTKPFLGQAIENKAILI